MPGVSTIGPGAEESSIPAVIWVEVASPMGAAQPPTLYQLPSAQPQAGTGCIS